MNRLSNLRGEEYQRELSNIFRQYGNAIIEDSKALAHGRDMQLTDIGRVALKYGLSFKATCEFLEKEHVILSGTYNVIRLTGIRVSHIMDSAKENPLP